MGQRTGNFFLDTYSEQGDPALLSRFERVHLPLGTTLQPAEERPRHVHFHISGLSSLVTVLEDGAEVEVAMNANEGFPEAIFLLGPEVSPRTCLMQIAGDALRMPFGEFEEVFQHDMVLHRLVLRLLQYQGFMSSQLVACNGKHDVEERLARWLLMVQDRLQSAELPLTQEFLGQMLGARRSTVTIAASNLQRAGMIEYRRGHIQVLGRERLVDTACECYKVIQGLYRNLYSR
jgi:CRP-like cAMP-binding protein